MEACIGIYNMSDFFCKHCGNRKVREKEITIWDYCDNCGTLKRGTSKETAECPNTNCQIRRKNHGITAHIDRHCSCCGKILYITTNSAYCANDECDRYMREQ